MEDTLTQEIVVPTLSVIESQERAQIDMLISTAKKFPRDLVRAKRSMEAMATLDAETAEGCNYTLKRKDKAGAVVLIQGPSVRMAEIAVACYGNIRAGSRIVSNDGKVITGQAFCHDLENNTFIAWETQRRITDKNGRTYGDDLQALTGNAATAIAFRNAVFKIVQGALIKPVADKALQVAVGDIKTLEQRRQRSLKKFATLGIDEERLLKSLGKTSVAQIDIVDVENLFGIFTAIKEGTVTIEEQFPIETNKVVEPNFQQPPAADLAPHFQQMKEAVRKAEPAETEKESRARAKAELEEAMEKGRQAESNVGRPSRSEVGPSAAAPVEAPEPPTKPVAPPKPPRPPKEAPPATNRLEKLHTKLAEDTIDHTKFLLVLFDFGLLDPKIEREDISAGNVDISQLDDKALDLAAKNWKQVLEEVAKL